MTDPLVEVRELKKYFYEQDSMVDKLLRNEPVSIKAVDGVSFDILPGETLGLVGESGCGKSTCGETLLRLQEPTDGTVRFDGEGVFDRSRAEMKSFRRNAQFIFQDPFSSLDPRIPIGDSVAEPLVIHGWPESDPAVETTATVETAGVSEERVSVSVDDDVDRVLRPDGDEATVAVLVEQHTQEVGSNEPTKQDDEPGTAGDDETLPEQFDEPGKDGDDGIVASVDEPNLAVSVNADGEISVEVSVAYSGDELRKRRAADLLERVGISPDQLDRYPHEFSGGQRQRIGIARALALEPDFLVLDEPTSALDVSVQAQILNLLADLQDEFDLTYLLISHDLSVIRHISDRVAVMYLGEIIEIGPSQQIFENPQHPYTQALLESVPRASTDEKERDIDTLTGDVPSPRNPPSGCRFRTRCPKIIPPADRNIAQDAYRELTTIRQLIDNRTLDIEGIKSQLRDEGEAVGTAEVVDHLEDRFVTVNLDPTDAETLDTALSAVVEGDWERAETLLRAEYESVCERRAPDLGKEAHRAACHLLDEPTGAFVEPTSPEE